jgi:hypothetical protein
MPVLNGDAWFSRNGLVFRKLVDGGMIYDREEKRVHHLNSTAACVWENCQKGRTTEQIVRDLCCRFEVETQPARADVESLLARFCQLGLIES